VYVRGGRLGVCLCVFFFLGGGRLWVCVCAYICVCTCVLEVRGTRHNRLRRGLGELKRRGERSGWGGPVHLASLHARAWPSGSPRAARASQPQCGCQHDLPPCCIWRSRPFLGRPPTPRGFAALPCSRQEVPGPLLVSGFVAPEALMSG